jgi:hypothetical protein
MVDILVQEEVIEGEGVTGLCMEYLLKHGVLNTLVSISSSDVPLGIRGETIRTLTNLVNLLDAKFLVHSSVHLPTLKLLKLCISDDDMMANPGGLFNFGMGITQFYVDDLIELLYTLCAKIHSTPELLNIFFYDKRWLTGPQRGGSETSKTTSPTNIAQDLDSEPEYECLLFTYLLKFVHREGKSGDYARTGLLFLLEIASGGFRDFVLVQSDLGPILSASLGALYSQLPRKLIVKSPDSPLTQSKGHTSPSPTTITRNLELEDSEGVSEVQVSNSISFHTVIDSFLKTLEFCQDVLQRCPSQGICQSILKSVKEVFLENILYPSMLESSDLDGSAVAVVSYLDIILQTLRDGELLDLFINYLLNLEIHNALGMQDMSSSGPNSPMSMNQELKPEYLAFNLKDLILNNLQSDSIPTKIAALKLLDTLVSYHPNYAHHLFDTQPINPKESPQLMPGNEYMYPTIHSHYREWEKYNELIKEINSISNNVRAGEDDASINGELGVPLGFEHYVRDLEATYFMSRVREAGKIVEFNHKSHSRKQTAMYANQRSPTNASPTFMNQSPIPQPIKSPRPSSDNVNLSKLRGKDPLNPRVIRKILDKDPIMQQLFISLENFFDHSCEVNLALTSTITSIMGCISLSISHMTRFKDRVDVSFSTAATANQLRKSQRPYNEPTTPNPQGDSEGNPQIPDDDRDSGYTPHSDYDSDSEDDLDDDQSIYEDYQLRPLDQIRYTVHQIEELESSTNTPLLYHKLSQLITQIHAKRQEVKLLGLWLEERRRAVMSSHYPNIMEPNFKQMLNWSTPQASRKPSLVPESSLTPEDNLLLNPSLDSSGAHLKTSLNSADNLVHRIYLDNLLVLEEWIKEIMANLLVHEGMGWEWLLYV